MFTHYSEVQIVMTHARVIPVLGQSMCCSKQIAQKEITYGPKSYLQVIYTCTYVHM